MDERNAQANNRRAPTAEADRPGRLAMLVGLAVGGAAALVGLVLQPFRRRRPSLPGVDAEDLAAGHETSDVSVRSVVAVGVGLAMLLAIVLVALTALQASYTQRPLSPTALPGLEPLPTPQLPPEPRLETEPGQQLSQYRAQQEQRLNSYGWVDRPNGIVHIPIDRAIEVLAQGGLPARPATEAQQYRDQGGSSPSGTSSGRVEEPIRP